MQARPGPLCLILAIVVASGCGDEPKKKVKTRETLHKYTQNVLKLPDALQQGGVLASTTIPVADPLTQDAAAYRTTVAKIGGMAVEQAIQIRNAQSINDPKPLSYEEFMAEIIKKDQPDGIQLAMLPYYQEYAWDEQSQKLVVVDFPAKKAAFQKQQDKELGR
jgi:hypothetical protein